MTNIINIIKGVSGSWIFLPSIKALTACIVALTTLSSCIDEKIVDEPAAPKEENPSLSSSDNVFLTVNILANTVKGTRGDEDSNYYDDVEHEKGQTWENDIDNIFLILSKQNEDKVIDVIPFLKGDTENETEITTSDNINYTAITKITRDRIKGWLPEGSNLTSYTSYPVKMYVVCNYKNGSFTMPGKDEPVQKTLSLATFDSMSDYGSFTTSTSTTVDGGTTTSITPHYFLMTNGDYSNRIEDGNKNTLADKYFKTIDISNLITHTEKTNPYEMNPGTGSSIPVQRNLARIDLKLNKNIFYFSAEGEYLGTGTTSDRENDNDGDVDATGAPEGWKTSIYIEYVGLMNVNKQFNLFKEVGVPGENGVIPDYSSTTDATWGYFWAEMPIDEANCRYVFTNNYSTRTNLTSSTTKDNSSYYLNSILSAGNFRTQSNYKGGAVSQTSTPMFDLYRSVTNPAGVSTGTNPTDHNSDYMIWRYCTPNTIHEIEKQKAGISTGVVFIARMNFNGGLGEGTTRAEIVGSAYEPTPIYFWNGLAIGTNYDLQGKVQYPNSVQERAMSDAYKAAYKELTGNEWNFDEGPTDYSQIGSEWVNFHKLPDWGYTNEDDDASKQNKRDNHFKVYNILPSQDFAAKLTKYGFSIFIPMATRVNGHKEYRCFYYGWIKHIDNGNNGIMGPMEFGVVRNNIYQLSINSIKSIGHPIPQEDLDTDPDPVTADEDDETVKPMIEIHCNVLPWNLRIDDNVTLF